MARVVQRRGGPAYATFVLVFLALGFLVAAVVFGSYWDTAKAELTRKNNETSSLINPSDRDSASYKAYVDESKKAGRTTVGYMVAQLNQLGQDRQDLSTKLATAMADAERLRAENKSLDDARKDMENQCSEAKLSLSSQRTTFDTELDKAAKELQAERDRNKSLGDQYDKALADARQSWSARLDDKDRELADKDNQIRKTEHDLLVAKTQLAEAVRNLGDLKRQPEKAAAADGRVLTVDAQKNIAYVDIGQQDKIHIGATFAVFDGRGEIKVDTKPKARVIVKNVMDKTSQVEIVQSTPGNPVMAGDIISNVAYDKRSTPVFVVVGTFDLNGDGNEDEHGVETVQSMIREYGGKVSGQISPDVDYLVTGDPPKLPTKPGPGTPASQMQLWQEKAAKLDSYRKAVDDARGYQIPTLNTNRLLMLLGKSMSAG